MSSRYQSLACWVRSRTRAMMIMVCALVVLAGGWWAYGNYESNGTPSCSWPLRIRGTATGEQAGLVRCYVQALASRNTAQLYAVAANIPPAHLTARDFRYARDARAGLATATFTPNPYDTMSVFVTIRFADGAVDQTGMLNMTAMGGASVWRMAIGRAYR